EARDALAPGGVVDLVVHVGDVGDEPHAEAPPLEEALQHGVDDVRAGVPHVDGSVDGGPAHVDSDRPVGAHQERLLAPGDGGVEPGPGGLHHASTRATGWQATPSPRPVKPMPSEVVAWTVTGAPRAAERAASMAPRYGARRGRSQTITA